MNDTSLFLRNHYRHVLFKCLEVNLNLSSLSVDISLEQTTKDALRGMCERPLIG